LHYKTYITWFDNNTQKKGLMSVYWDYILAAKRHRTLCTGVSGDLPGYNYTHSQPTNVCSSGRARCIKPWSRAWQLRLIAS